MTYKSVSVTALRYLICLLLLGYDATYWIPEIRSSFGRFHWPKTFLIPCLRFSVLDCCVYTTSSFIIIHVFWIQAIPEQRSCFCSEPQWISLIGDDKSHLHEDQAAVDVYVQFQVIFEQFRSLGSIHSCVRRNGTQTSSATARHGTSNHLARG